MEKDTKVCQCCGDIFQKSCYDSWRIWETRRFCSTKCASKSRDRTNIGGQGRMKSDGCYSNMLKDWKEREININNKYKTWQLNH